MKAERQKRKKKILKKLLKSSRVVKNDGRKTKNKKKSLVSARKNAPASKLRHNNFELQNSQNCHSREGGNPDLVNSILDSRLRGNDRRYSFVIQSNKRRQRLSSGGANKLKNKYLKLAQMETYSNELCKTLIEMPAEKNLYLLPDSFLATKKEARQAPKFSLFENAFFRLASAVFAVIMFVAILNITPTNSYFNDEEKSVGNIYSAGILDFNISPSLFDPTEASLNFGSGTTTSKTINFALTASSDPVIYFASTTNLSGDIPFCQQISVNASLNGNFFGSGILNDFKSAMTTNNSATTTDIWKFDFTSPSVSAIANSVCSFDMQYDGKQANPYLETGGFSDTHTASSTLYSWGFRINKVYYNVAPDRGNDGENEWVEIYNQTDQSLDISGWKICDDSGDNNCNTIPASNLIPAKGFAVVTASSTSWQFWNLEDNVVPIVLGHDIGDGLGNNGDRLILKRPDGVAIDEMNWGADTGVWNPAVPNVSQGHMLGRKPNGYDTNQPSDFVDFAPPVLNLTYPDQSGTLVWYWTYNYPISWTATNPNGPDSDLKINLSYIKDEDSTNTITPADSTHDIEKNIANTGIYNWTVPSGFIGYIWINIGAFGSENPMLNSEMTSGKIYDPTLVKILVENPLAIAKDNFGSTTLPVEIPEIKPSAPEESIITETATSSATTTENIESENSSDANNEIASTTENVIENPPAIIEEPAPTNPDQVIPSPAPEEQSPASGLTPVGEPVPLITETEPTVETVPSNNEPDPSAPTTPTSDSPASDSSSNQ